MRRRALLALLGALAARPAAAQIDARATAETRALFGNLRRLAGRQIMFGHQDDLAYGHDAPVADPDVGTAPRGTGACAYREMAVTRCSRARAS